MTPGLFGVDVTTIRPERRYTGRSDIYRPQYVVPIIGDAGPAGSAVVVTRVLVGVVVVAALCGFGFAFYRMVSDLPQTETSRPMVKETFTIGGQPTTCEGLFGSCDFNLQTSFNQWGRNLDVFGDAPTLGPYGREIGFPASAKLGLQACEIARAPGRTYLEFLDVAHVEHPEATSPQLFPFWDLAARELCPIPR
ncbi:hypothetical protein [Rhodococcus sp. AG1013]|uniref:hypothetical protein n=1 Tax=unclassified Rhodococcus (in: high G+C Gram-positive bacteria) TaxID=192944 RepID=UPI000E2D5989|nr:hypothetical protein [Rhodococcus sp. AG1013]RDI28133.1 hypothetical protein DEU38_107105 [Rhodococcus sp. AG1013]